MCDWKCNLWTGSICLWYRHGSLTFHAQFAIGPLAFHLTFRILIVLGTKLTFRHILCALVRVHGASHLFIGQSPILSTLKLKVKLLSRVRLFATLDCSLPGFSIHGIFQARVIEWVAISFSRGSSWSGDRTQVSHNASRCFTLWATREATNGIICPCFLVLPWWIPLTLA